ncbi:MAG TPA: P-loop NTPase [Ruminiclostridium sp.]
MKIAVSGKGGVGKTTISANLAKLFVHKGFNVYAVDADPDSSLGLALGISEEELSKVKPVIEMREFIGDQVGDGAYYTLNPMVNDIADKFSVNINGIKFLRMGGIKQGGSDCYCRENTFLKAMVNSLLLDTKDVVILDMGAGIEHLTRGTSKGVDLMLIVTEAGKSSVQTAKIVENLARQLEITNIKFIANKIRSEKEEFFIKEHFNNDQLLGVIHYDQGIAEKSMGINLEPTKVDNKELEKMLEKVLKF